MLSDHARSLFEVEIRNEREGGVSAATHADRLDADCM
jgi:hypothetical protein